MSIHINKKKNTQKYSSGFGWIFPQNPISSIHTMNEFGQWPGFKNFHVSETTLKCNMAWHIQSNYSNPFDELFELRKDAE